MTDPVEVAPVISLFSVIQLTITVCRFVTVLSRVLASKGIYPAVDPFNSTSKMLDPSYVRQEHFCVASNVKQMLQW